MGNEGEREIWEADGRVPDGQTQGFRLSLDKKVDRLTYGGATVQAMDKNGYNCIKGLNEAYECRLDGL